MSTKIRRLEYIPASDYLTVWFEESGDEPFSPEEFMPDSKTRIVLDTIRELMGSITDISNYVITGEV